MATTGHSGSFQRHPRERARLLAVVLMTSVACKTDVSSSPMGASPCETNNLVIMGIDGATWDIMKPLIERGDLPNFARLGKDGVHGPLQTLKPTISPMIWTSVATGMHPSKHGIVGFTTQAFYDKEWRFVPIDANARRTKALWNIVNDHNKRAFVFGWMSSWPAEPIDGVVVTDAALFGAKKRSVHSSVGALPDYAREELARIREMAYLKNWPFILGDNIESLRAQIQLHTARDQLTARLALHYLPQMQGDLMMVYFKGLDSIEHTFWKYMDFDGFVPHAARIHDDEVLRYGILDHYVLMDNVLGQFLAALDQRDTLLVLSDHGHEPAQGGVQHLPIHLNHLLEALGYLKYRDSERIDIAWDETVAFFPLADRGGHEQEVALNLRGRFPFGHVKPDDAKLLCRKIEKALRAVVFASNGMPAFRVGPCPEDRASCDLVVKLPQAQPSNDEIRVGTRTFPFSALYTKLTRSGQHHNAPPGIALFSGPALRRNEATGAASVMDITPTVLTLLGIPVGEDMDGKVLQSVISPECRVALPTRHVPSHERADSFKAAAPAERVSPGRSDAEEQILNELRSLGYVGGPAE